MKTQKAINHEFKMLYRNLVELCRRVYSEEEVPRTTCAVWFIETLGKIVNDEHLKRLLTEQIIIHILEMGKNMLRVEYIDNSYKSQLRKYAQQLKALRAEVVEDVNGLA